MVRGASPLQQATDPEELRRAVSPQNSRAQRPSPNDLTSQPAGKPRRVPGGEDDAEGSTDSAIREHALSPDQTRALSPPAHAHGGTPTGPSIENVVKTGQRSESPLVERERTKSPESPNYGQQQSNLTSVNGLSSNHSTKSGSTSDISTDIIRDLKARDAELETLRRRQAWMKAALVQACHAGFVYVNASPGDEDRGVTNEQPKIAEAVITLKQLHGSIQVRSHYFARIVAKVEYCCLLHRRVLQSKRATLPYALVKPKSSEPVRSKKPRTTVRNSPRLRLLPREKLRGWSASVFWSLSGSYRQRSLRKLSGTGS